MNELTKGRRIISSTIRYTLLILVGLMMIYPMIWMIGASFKSSNAEIFSSIGFIPKNPSIQAYLDGWNSTTYTYGTYMMNTFKIVLPKVLGTVVSCVLTAYAFTRFNFKGKTVMYALCISTLFLPQVVLNIPQYLLFRNFNWLDSYKPLVAPSFFAVDTYFVFVLVQFMRTLSKDLEEAAFIDGCNSFQTLYKIIVPLVRPSIISVALFQFMWSCNDFQGPLIYVNAVERYPAALGLRLMMDAEAGFQWNKVLAMSVITILPSLIVFFVAQDQFVDGITAGGVKG